jgi:hypothetical protein
VAECVAAPGAASGDARRTAAPILLPYHPEKPRNESNDHVSAGNVELLVDPCISRRIRGLIDMACSHS